MCFFCCSSGESMHQLSSAEEMRDKLAKLFQNLEILSGKIAKYEEVVVDDEKALTSNNKSSKKDQTKLQNNIRYFAINYIKDNSFSLGTLPSNKKSK